MNKIFNFFKFKYLLKEESYLGRVEYRIYCKFMFIVMDNCEKSFYNKDIAKKRVDELNNTKKKIIYE